MSAFEHRTALKPGHRINWYEIRKILGQGGFGITYLAIDTNLDQEVAIKEYLPVEFAVRDGDHTVHPASGDHGERFQWGKERFMEEARTLARFKHPNIVRVFSVFEAMNTAYMVMEYERGQSLQDMLPARRTLDETRLLAIALPIMDGLQCVHEAGFIHRDIKPANIFVREDGSPVLLDFGSARQAMGNATRTLTALVSPGYAPFEQYYSKSDEQGPWTDIYGLGATLYRAAAGVPPMDAMDRSRSLLESTPDTFISTASMTEGRYSERFQRAVDHALRFKQAERPQSIIEWRRDFGIDQVVEELRRLESDQAATTQPTRIVRPQGPQKPKRSRAPFAVAAGVLALAAAAYVGMTRFAPTTAPAVEPANSDGTVPATTTSAAAAEPIPVPAPAPSPVAETGTANAPDQSPAADAEAPAQNQADSTPSSSASLVSGTTGTDADETESQRITAFFAVAEAEREAPEVSSRRVDQAAAQAAEEQQRLAAVEAELQKLAREQREAEQRRVEAEQAEAARVEEQLRLAAIEAEQQKLAREQREAKQRRAEAERAEAARLAEQQRLAALQARTQACKVQQQSPETEPARAGGGSYFAAIAVGTGNGWGEAWGYGSRNEAEQVALAGCLQNDSGCEVQVWTNDCIAFATDADGAAGWSWGASINEARSKAIGFCESHSACCTVMTAFCADELEQ